MPMISRVILFGGEQFFHVSYVCIAWVEGSPVGIASLSHKDKPLLEGIWVKPGFRPQGIATKLLDAVVELSVKEYEEAPSAEAVTAQGWAFLCKTEIDAVNLSLLGINIP